MPHCPNCGTRLSESQNFCRQCGNEVSHITDNSGGNNSRRRQDRAGQNAGGRGSSARGSAPSRHVADQRGEYVTAERVRKVEDILDSEERVHYLTRGSTIDVEGSSSGTSLWGDDRSRKTGTRGYVRAAITGKRVVVKIPQWLGSDERSVPYQNITSVDLDTGLVNKRLTLQTPGQTYHIEAHEPGKEEVRNAARFVRTKITESQDETVVVEESSEPDPTEQLKNLKELHEQGVLSDAEFEEKKSELLDKL